MCYNLREKEYDVGTLDMDGYYEYEKYTYFPEK